MRRVGSPKSRRNETAPAPPRAATTLGRPIFALILNVVRGQRILPTRLSWGLLLALQCAPYEGCKWEPQ
jgi:hypothetical protein